MPPTPKPVIAERLWRDAMHQTCHYELIQRAGTHRLRVQIERNAYDDQSCARIQRWDGAQWQGVSTWPISACDSLAVSAYERPEAKTGRCDLELMQGDAARLVAEAWAIINTEG